MAARNGPDSEKNFESYGRTTNEPHEGEYGFGGCTPKFLQWLNNPKGFLVTMFVAVLAITMVSGGALNINAVPLERRFGLDSTQTGLIAAGYDIGFFVMTLFISYFGMNASRPKLVAIGSAVFGLGCLIYSLPHFTTGNYNFGAGQLQVTCPLPGANATTCFQSENLNGYLGLLLLGSILTGVGATPFFTVGLAFIEDSVQKNSGSLFLGIVNAGAILGPMIGFLAGAEFLLDYFVDFDAGVQTALTYFDARWVGAWWMIPLIAMGIAWITVIPLAGFPRQLPGTNRVRAARVSEAHDDGGSQMARTNEFGTIREFPKAFWIMIRNPVFVCITLSACCQAVTLNGVSAFLSKFLENEFHLTTGRASELSGAILVPAGALGHILAGILISRLKWNTKTMLKFTTVCSLLVTCLVPISFLHCNNDNVAGVTVPYSFGAQLPNGAVLQVKETLRPGNLTAGCNARCSCQEEFFIPVCGADGKTYFSPCHAGCFGAKIPNGSTLPSEFTLCQCVSSIEKLATPGACTTTCGSVSAFLGVMFFLVMFSFAPLTPSLVMTFRVVPEKMRSFAVGVQWLFVRGIGTVPGPLIYGALIDLTCILWQTRQCDGSRGSCWIYNNRQLNIMFVCAGLILNSLAALLYVIAGCVYKPEYDGSSYSSGEAIKNRKKDVSTIDTASENAGYEEHTERL